jgi:hypothetical protein
MGQGASVTPGGVNRCAVPAVDLVELVPGLGLGVGEIGPFVRAVGGP